MWLLLGAADNDTYCGRNSNVITNSHIVLYLPWSDIKPSIEKAERRVTNRIG